LPGRLIKDSHYQRELRHGRGSNESGACFPIQVESRILNRRAYWIAPNNTGSNQKCELDHLISLEIGSADDLSNIWPQCSPGYADWNGASFRDKDKFENYLHRMVCARSITLVEAQKEISIDWFQYWSAAGKPDN
jgi:hypothetical protein